ncbi:MAG: hypothetical protein CXT67_00165 [Methanobacteriota archaeon]|nr:MAG: hypothetical protein CXT67_00165 [Euryarchaeota archaeon]
MKTKYEQEIEDITEQRAKLAARMNDLVRMKDVEKSLKSCAEDGHVWTLTTVGSDLWNVWTISLLCTRCNGLLDSGQIDPSGTIAWDAHETSVLKEMVN